MKWLRIISNGRLALNFVFCYHSVSLVVQNISMQYDTLSTGHVSRYVTITN
jgi:hypothetical protein